MPNIHTQVLGLMLVACACEMKMVKLDDWLFRLAIDGVSFSARSINFELKTKNYLCGNSMKILLFSSSFASFP